MHGKQYRHIAVSWLITDHNDPASAGEIAVNQSTGITPCRASRTFTGTLRV